jgi:hypothetical protein
LFNGAAQPNHSLQRTGQTVPLTFWTECELPTLIHTSPFEAKLQYLVLDKKNAEFLAPLFSFQHLVLGFLLEKL